MGHKTILWSLLACLLLPGASQAQQLSAAEMREKAAEEEMQRQELVNLQGETVRAIQMNNTAFFRRVFSDDYLGTFPSGRLMDKNAPPPWSPVYGPLGDLPTAVGSHDNPASPPYTFTASEAGRPSPVRKRSFPGRSVAVFGRAASSSAGQFACDSRTTRSLNCQEFHCKAV
jgi:hypothetical protein